MLFLRIALMSFLMVFHFNVFSKEITRNDRGISALHEKAAVAKWIVAKTKNRASQQYADFIVEEVYKNAKLNGVDPLIILGMITKESMFKKTAKSGYGAKGLMQVVPRYHNDKLKNRDPYRVDVNVEVGSKYLRYCLDNRKTFNGAMNCYSGGAKGYSNFVLITRKEIKQSIVLALFENDQNIQLAYNSNKAFIPKTNDILVAGI